MGLAVWTVGQVAGVWRAFLVPFQAVSFRYDAEHVAIGCDLPPGVDAGREAAWQPWREVVWGQVFWRDFASIPAEQAVLLVLYVGF